MCGIVGYIGKDQASGSILKGLKALEYRGYDSAGLAVFDGKKLRRVRSKGKVKNLEEKLTQSNLIGQIGIGHTRWATHGQPSEENAHPHFDCSNTIAVVHNGIIENYQALKEYLEIRGHKFSSETDTEVVAHLIEDFIKSGQNFKTAFLSSLKMIKGAYALLVLDQRQPEIILASRLSSPLIIGVGNNENFLASDPSALVGQTKEVIYLKDRQVAEISSQNLLITDIDDNHIDPEVEKLEWDLEEAQKGDYSHFMLKEIFEGPNTVKASIAGRLLNDSVKLGGLEEVDDKLKDTKRLVIVACGTSYYAGLIAEYFFEELTGLPCEVHLASEFRTRVEPLDPKTAVLAISQSGETADTLGALQKAKENNLLTLGVVNVVGSTIARETDAGVYNHAGPEVGVASTKAFISQVVVLLLISLYVGQLKGNNLDKSLIKELTSISEKMSLVLDQNEQIKKLADQYFDFDNFLFLGRRYTYPTALEGALKLKEISYVHAEGFGAGEMKHGPLALIDQNFPTMALALSNSVSEKMYSNLEEIKSRGGSILAIANPDDERIKKIANDVIYIPKTLEPLEPIVSVVALQLFAYHAGVLRGFDVDKPRNLAKSVTVE